MKNYGILAFALIVGTCMHAQTLQDAVKKTDNERYEVAGAEFKALVAKEPAVADNYFYYGENYVQLDELDSANMMWQKGLSIDPNSALNMVGAGKYLWYKGDTLSGKQKFTAALTLTKNKNAEVMRQIGSVYIYAPIQSLKQAITILNQAVKLEPKNVEGHLLLGDALLELTPENGSAAMKSYNDALTLERSAKNVVRKAKVYQRAGNAERANEMYQEAQDLDPTYAPAFRANAELNMKYNQSSKAIENWKKYLALNNSDYGRYRYASSLFSGKKYCEAVTEFETLHKNGFVNMYTERLLGYSLYECNKDVKADTAVYVKGMEAMDRYFKTVPQDKILASDYKFKGLLYVKMAKDSLAIIELEKAISKDTSAEGRALNGETAKLYLKNKQYDLAIAAYNKKMNGDSTQLSAAEYYDLGKAYYFFKNYVLADSAYAMTAKLAPTYAMAYLWRGRSNLQLDLKKVTWAAKPHYEKMIETVPVEERKGPYAAFLIEAAKYLGDYYVNKEKNTPKAKEYWGLVRELDPKDKQAAAFFASPLGK